MQLDIKVCPNCRSVCPPNVPWCGCGYDFVSRRVVKNPSAASNPDWVWDLALPFLFEFPGAMIAVFVGMLCMKLGMPKWLAMATGYAVPFVVAFRLLQPTKEK